VASLQERTEVIGIVLTGSGVDGFKDRYSDIDMMVILDKGGIFALSYEKIKQWLLMTFDSQFYFEVMRKSDDMLLCAMLGEFTEIDLQVVSQEALVIRTDHTKVLFDRHGTLATIMDEAFSETQTVAPRRVYLELVERIWQPVLRCLSALSRGEVWRALHNLEEVRDKAVQIAGINHKLSTRAYSEVDQLPEMFLVALRRSLPANTSATAIHRALRHTLALFFMEAQTVERLFRLDVARKMEAVLMPYVDAHG
jgi:hypothetical protein